jgi:hypothetical protein
MNWSFSTSRATHEARAIVIDMVRRVADCVFIPFTVGGGIRSVDDMRAILLAGADKGQHQQRGGEAPGADHRGGDALWQPMHRRRQSMRGGGRATTWRRAGRDGMSLSAAGASTRGLDAVAWAREVERRGAGEILLTSMDGDGTKEGYDIALTRAVSGRRLDPGDRQRRRGSAGTLPAGADRGRRGRSVWRPASFTSVNCASWRSRKSCGQRACRCVSRSK